MRRLLSYSVLAGLLLFSSLSAKQWKKSYSLDPFIGPEIYHVKRLKEGGAQQSGNLYGVRIGYDRIKRYKFYWGIDALWAQGILTGKNDRKDHLKSQMSDLNVEARLGYTIQSKCWRCASITPYVGGGYFEEINNYKHPTPLPVHFKNKFTYIPFGFLSQIFVYPFFSVGLNVKIRYLIEAEQEVTNDPKYKKLKQHYEENFQYRIELPFNYFFCWKSFPLAIGIVPFYEYRHYGHRANFPFDFLDVKLEFYGATLKLHYLF